MHIQRTPPAIEDLSRSLQARIARDGCRPWEERVVRKNAANVPSIPAIAIHLTSVSVTPRPLPTMGRACSLKRRNAFLENRSPSLAARSCAPARQSFLHPVFCIQFRLWSSPRCPTNRS